LVDRLESGLVLSDAPGSCFDAADEPVIPVDAPVELLALSFFAAGLVPMSVLVEGLPPVEFALVSLSAANAGEATIKTATAVEAKRDFICFLHLCLL
jgi:hypothetical protein